MNNSNKEHAIKARIDAAGGSIDQAERVAARDINVQPRLPLLGIGMILVILAVFFPHSGSVRGFDLLLDTPVSQENQSGMPERVYMMLAVGGGLLLTIGTIVSRSWLVAWVNWIIVGIGWWYSIFAIWMTQTRPSTHPGDGPSYGVILGALGLSILLLTLVGVLFEKSPVHIALALARREEAHRTEENRLAQQRLRTGIEPREDAVIVDDRRARVKARRATARKESDTHKA